MCVSLLNLSNNIVICIYICGDMTVYFQTSDGPGIAWKICVDIGLAPIRGMFKLSYFNIIS